MMEISIFYSSAHMDFMEGEGVDVLIDSVNAFHWVVLYFTTLPSLHQVEGNQT